MKKKEKGFTLIELMIVVAIVGVIGAIAVPSYNSYLLKSRRADAKVGLTKIADKQERFYLQNNIYASTTAALGLANPWISDEGYYEITVTSGNVTGFALSASAVAGNVQAGDTTTGAGDCRVMTLNSTGARGGPPGLDDCW